MITHEKTSVPGNSISGNSIAGKMMVLEGMVLLVPLIVIPFYPGEARLSVIFLLPACLSVLDVEKLPHIFLLYRAFLQVK